MGKSVRNTDSGLPGLDTATPIEDAGDELPGLKKKDASAGSPSHSDSSPNTDPTAKPVNTSDSAPSRKTLPNNYKNNSLSPEDVHSVTNGPADLKDWNGLTPDQISHGINNKGANLSKWSDAPADGYISSLVNQHQQAQKKIEEMSTRQSMVGDVPNYDKSIKNMHDQEGYLRTEIQKNYDVRKKKVVPELINNLKQKVDVENWTDAYNKPDKEILGIKIPSPLQYDPKTHKLTPKSVEWVAKNVDDEMNKKGDTVVNAQVSGDLDKKDRTYADLTKSVVDYLNTIPVQKKQKEYTDDFTKSHPQLKDAFDATKNINEYFSKENVDAVKAKVNVNRDKEIMKTGQKYYGEGGIFFQNKDFVGIQEKYAQLVGDGKMTDAVAKKQIQAEIKENPSLKKINQNMEAEVRKINEKTQTEFQDYIVAGLRKKNPNLTVYKDGSVGVAGMSEEKYKNMIERYEGGLNDIAIGMGLDSNEAALNQANEKAKRVGAFWGSAGSSINDLTSAFSKFTFNKTQWGAKNVHYYEGQEIASPQIGQSEIAASWNWKGLESLKDPNFWLSKVGSMVPVIAGGSAIGLATDGAGMPEYIGWLANAGLFTAQSGLSTYNQLLNTRDAQGNLLTESDASNYMAEQMSNDFLPNVLMMAVTSGALGRAKNIVKPTIAATIKKGLLGAAEAQPFFTWQGYNDYATSQEAQGKKVDMWDYMQSKDFRDNLINGMVVGGGLSLVHAPGEYMKSVDNWTKMIHSSEGEFKNLIPQNYALGQEMVGNGNYLRDALKLHIFNTDPSTLDEAGKRQLADMKNQLLYSVNLDRNIKTGNLDPLNVKDLYQAHNLALADQHDYLSEQAAKEGNKSLSDIYKDKAKDYREQAKDAANDTAKFHYLVNEQGHPIFMSDNSFKALEAEGTIGKWMKDGTIKDVVKSDDPEFSQRYKDFVGAKDEATVDGMGISDHAKSLIEENKDKLGVYYAVAKENPEAFFKEVADQVFGNNATGDKSTIENAEKAAREQFGDDIVDTAKLMFPDAEKESVTHEVGKEEPKADANETDTPEYKKNIRDDYFAKADFFTPEEKEKFATLDEAGQDKMIDDKRAELKDQSGITVIQPGEFKPPNVVKPVEKGPSKISVIKPGEFKSPKVVEPETISSPIKPDDNGKTETKAEGRQDVLEDEEGEKANSMKDEPVSPPSIPPPEPPRVVAESPKEEFTSVRKEKNAEIAGAKELFEKQKVVKWSDTYTNALANVQTMYPAKNLYDAMKSRVDHFTTMLDSKTLFNPTSEDIAVFNVFKNETMQRMGTIEGWDSSDPVQALSAQAEFASLQSDLFNVVRVTNPGGEAGRAFNLLQSEIANDPEHGLQIRRMELAGAKGAKLTEAELESTAKDWEKERDIIEKEYALKEKAMQERFDKEMAKVKAQAGKESKPKFNKEKAGKVATSLKSFADRFEKFGSANLPEGTQSMGIDLQKKIADAIRWVADKIASGDIRIPDIISAAIDKFKGKDDEEELRANIQKGLSEAGVDEKLINDKTQKEQALEKIKVLSDASGSKGITNEMVAKNLIRDYVNSHIGFHDQEDILETAFKDLKKELPDLEKPKLLEAYLKENEFKQPTSKELKDGEIQAKRQLKNIARLEEDIADLSGYKDVRQRSFPTDKDRSEYERKLTGEKEAIIKDRQDKIAQNEKEYRGLETERNRQQKIVEGLKKKLSTLELSQKPTTESKTPVKDTPEIEALKSKIKEAQEKMSKDKADRKSEYNKLETERNRQLKAVSDLQEKLENLRKGSRAKAEKGEAKNDTPEIESLKKEVKQADKDLRDAENEIKRINREADKKTADIAQYNYEIQRLKERGELQKRSKGKSVKDIDKDIQEKQKQLSDTLRDMGIKTSGEDKYTKASYDQRAKAHNERLSDISKQIENKLTDPNLSDEAKKQLTKLKGQLDASQIKLDPNSALSQQKTLEAGIAALKGIKSEFTRTTSGDILKVGDIGRGLQKVIDKFNSDKEETEQDVKLQRAKDAAASQKEEFTRKIAAGEFEDNPIVHLTKTDAQLIRLEREKNRERQNFQDKKNAFEKGKEGKVRKFFGFLRAAEVASLIGRPLTLAKVGASALIRPNLEAITKMTFGKAIEGISPTLAARAKLGGEGSSIKSIQKGYEAYLRQYSPEQLEKLYDVANEKYEKSASEYQKAKGELDQIKDKDSKEYKDAEKDLQKLSDKKNNDLIDAVGNSIYQFIAGSSVKEATEVLLHRSTELERQLGHFDREAWDSEGGKNMFNKKSLTDLDNINYAINFIGRSHAALKNFSARFSFATGFMARLEASVENGVDISRNEKILEIAHESYIDWDRGKYQEPNWVTDTWNKITNAVERVSPEFAYLLRADVAITLVPVNMLREGIMEYTLGGLTGSYLAGKEYLNARKIALQSNWGPDEQAQFKQELSEQLKKMDPDKAAAIVRAYRKGGFGAGLYALALLGHVAFGGWAHKGMTAEDKKKTARELETGEPEIKTSEIKIGDWKVPEAAAKILEHTPAFAPLGFGLGLARVYHNNITDGKSTIESATNSVMGQVNHISGSIPMIDKVAMPLAAGAVQGVKQSYFSGQWDDVDQQGNPMKRKAFELSDYLTYLPGFSKKDALSERYYKQAVQVQKSFRDQITDIETNTSLSKKDKEEQREDLLKQMKESIDDIYKQNKDNPE